VFISLLHWLVESQRHSTSHTVGEDSVIFAGMFLLFFLRGSLFFGAMGIFSNLFRGEMLEKTLHYYFLTPIRRELLVAGKYLAGLTVSLMLFVPSTALTFLLLGRHFGPAWTRLPGPRPRPEPVGFLRSGNGSRLRGLRRGVPGLRPNHQEPHDRGRG